MNKLDMNKMYFSVVKKGIEGEKVLYSFGPFECRKLYTESLREAEAYLKNEYQQRASDPDHYDYALVIYAHDYMLYHESLVQIKIDSQTVHGYAEVGC